MTLFRLQRTSAKSTRAFSVNSPAFRLPTRIRYYGAREVSYAIWDLLRIMLVTRGLDVCANP